MTRIHLPGPLVEGLELVLPDTAFRHLVHVLRLRENDAFVAFDGRGGEYRAVLMEAGKRRARARLAAHDPVNRESPLDLRLAQCVSKGERMDYTLQKAVELGVTRVTPLISERCAVKLDAERWEKKLEHWRGVIVAACEQSARACRRSTRSCRCRTGLRPVPPAPACCSTRWPTLAWTSCPPPRGR
jgi:16S rRNA (uracil1498-N3)-methyltransferase